MPGSRSSSRVGRAARRRAHPGRTGCTHRAWCTHCGYHTGRRSTGERGATAYAGASASSTTASCTPRRRRRHPDDRRRRGHPAWGRATGRRRRSRRLLQLRAAGARRARHQAGAGDGRGRSAARAPWSAPSGSTDVMSSLSRATLHGRSDSTEPPAVAMRVELRAGEPFVRLALDWENGRPDHRLRLMSPPPSPPPWTPRASSGRGARPHRRGRAGGEHPLPTYPAERFVDAGGAAVLLRRTMEHEVVDRWTRDPDGSQALALTLLRSIGYLSRNVHPYRGEPAGPQLPTPEAQALGACHCHWRSSRTRGPGMRPASPRDRALPPSGRRGSGAGPWTDRCAGRGTEPRGAGVDLVSLRAAPMPTPPSGALVNMSARPTEAVIGWAAVRRSLRRSSTAGARRAVSSRRSTAACESRCARGRSRR